jgi:acetyl esterase
MALLSALFGVLVVSLVLAPHAAGQAARVERGLVYARPGGVPLRVDVYLPDGDGPHPAAVVLHGGGWSSGSRSGVAPIARRLAAEGIAAFAADYRLAPAHRFPAAVRDAQEAVRWVRANADRFGVDPSRLAAVGSSAGGHLAAMVGTLGDGARDEGARVRVVAAWSGPMDLAAPERQVNAYLREDAKRMVRGFLGCLRGCPERRTAASPVTHVDPSDAAMLLVNGTDELTPLPQAETMAGALRAAGIPVRVIAVPSFLHAQQFADELVPGSADTVEDATVRFVRTWLDARDAAADDQDAVPLGAILGTAGAVAAAGRRSSAR